MGWTIIGWVGALVWALADQPDQPHQKHGSNLTDIALQRATYSLPAPRRNDIPPPPGAIWHYRIARNGEDLGEFPVATIRQMLRSRDLTMEDYYFDTEANDWMQLDCLADLV